MLWIRFPRQDVETVLLIQNEQALAHPFLDDGVMFAEAVLVFQLLELLERAIVMLLSKFGDGRASTTETDFGASAGVGLTMPSGLGIHAALDLLAVSVEGAPGTEQLRFGIGAHYGIHVIHRYVEESETEGGDVNEAVEETARGVLLAALTTVVGFGSLATSHYPGLVSMGLVSIAGTLSTALVAIAVVPAWLAWRHGPRDRPLG